MEETKECGDCPHCRKREEDEKANEEMTLAVLVALIPMLVLTLFGQVGIL